MRYFYVISPVGTDPEFPAKKAILKTLGRQHEVEPFFPLEQDPVFARETVRKHIRGAEFILADLSLERPSCYFELGLAESLDAEVELIATSGTFIHQVGDAGAVMFYSDLNEYQALLSKILSQRSVG